MLGGGGGGGGVKFEFRALTITKLYNTEMTRSLIARCVYQMNGAYWKRRPSLYRRNRISRYCNEKFCKSNKYLSLRPSLCLCVTVPLSRDPYVVLSRPPEKLCFFPPPNKSLLTTCKYISLLKEGQRHLPLITIK